MGIQDEEGMFLGIEECNQFIIRDNKTLIGFSPNFELKIDDLILFTGSPENIEKFIEEIYSSDGDEVKRLSV